MTFNVISIGEVVWDMLPSGAVLGGASANFALHCRALGANADLVTAVGDDQSGREMLLMLAERGLSVDSVQICTAAATGIVSVELSSEGQPSYKIHSPSAWDFIQSSDDMIGRAKLADAICYGTLVQRSAVSRVALHEILALASDSSLKIFDANLRQNYYSPEILESSLKCANILKINSDELIVFSEVFGLYGDDLERITQLSNHFKLKCVALTRGGEGSLLLVDGVSDDHPGVPTTLKDAIGAGDAFTSALAIGLLSGKSVSSINEIANSVASFVASQSGAMPKLPERLTNLFVHSSLNS